MADMMNNLNLEVLKVPLGFIRLVELPFVLIAFASMSGWGMKFTYSYTCPPENKTLTQTIAINTFKLGNVMVSKDSCTAADTYDEPLFGQSYGGTSGFFIFVGVVCLLVVLATLAFYLFLWAKYETENRWALLDFVVTALFAVLWVLATIAWWAGANGVGFMTGTESIEKNLATRDDACKVNDGDDFRCKVTGDWGYGSLVISVLAGWVCVLLFVANCWFAFKETVWFRNRQSPHNIGPVGTGSPQGPLP